MKTIWRWLSGHVSVGPITVYGRNAMHWGVTISTHRWGYICFRLPLRCFGRWWPLYFYLSPNGTPWASTFYLGQDRRCDRTKMRARMRREFFGHNFDVEENYAALRQINDFYVRGAA
jgi:hypothetical protein